MNPTNANPTSAEVIRIVERWRTLNSLVMTMAKFAEAEPERAAELGIAREELRENGTKHFEPLYASWVRGTARALIPPCYQWELVIVMGGECHLVLREFRDDLSRIAPLDARAAARSGVNAPADPLTPPSNSAAN